MFIERMEREKIARNSILFAVVVILILAIAYYARFIILIGLIGIGLGVIVSPILDILQKKLSINRSLSAILVLIGFSLFIVAVFASIYYLLSEQFHNFAERLPELILKLNKLTTKTFIKYPWIKGQINSVDIGSSAGKGIIQVFAGFKIGIVSLSGLIFVIVVSIYTALDSKKYFSTTLELFPLHRREKVSIILQECSSVLRSWVKAQLLDMFIVGLLISIGLWICKFEYWAIFGLLSMIMEIIPYVGTLFVTVAASLITLVSNPEQLHWVILVFLLTHQLESHVIIPLVMKNMIRLPVVPLIFFMLFMGHFLDYLGYSSPHPYLQSLGQSIF